MGIKAGSGGLKYALPNQREIQARQNAAAASAGGSASASAFSANRRYAGLKNQLRYNSVQQELDRRFRAGESEKDRRFKYQQAAADRSQKAGLQSSQQQFQTEQLQKQQDFDAQELFNKQNFQAAQNEAERKAEEAAQLQQLQDRAKLQRLLEKQRQQGAENLLQKRFELEGGREEDTQQDALERIRIQGEEQRSLERLRQQGGGDPLEQEFRGLQLEDNAADETAVGPQSGPPGNLPVMTKSEAMEQLPLGTPFIDKDTKKVLRAK